MEFNPSMPIYLQVVTAIKRDIVTGKLKPGNKLPSVRELALKFSINPNTASRVYSELESEGVCFTKRGMGTFATEDPQMILQMKAELAQELVTHFIDGMRSLGIEKEEAMEFLKKGENEDAGI